MYSLQAVARQQRHGELLQSLTEREVASCRQMLASNDVAPASIGQAFRQQRSYETHMTAAEECRQGFARHNPVNIADRRPVEIAKLTVDGPDRASSSCRISA